MGDWYGMIAIKGCECVMKESKYSIYALGFILFINLFIIKYVDKNNIFFNIFSASFGGVAVSWVVAVITYFTEERKAIYNFYIAAEKYLEKLICFSQFLAESYMCLENETFESDKLETRYVVLNRLEKICDELYEEYIIIQKETREFEAYSFKGKKRRAIQYYMRKTYDKIFDILNCIKNCVELNYRNSLNKQQNYEKTISVYDTVYSALIEKKESENEYIPIECKKIDNFLNEFIKLKCISLRKGGIPIRNTGVGNYKLSNGMVPKEFSVRAFSERSVMEFDDYIKDI